MECEDVLERFELLQDFDLAIQQDSVDLVFQHFKINDLYGHTLVRVIIATFVDVAGVALADDIVQTI